MMKSDSPKNVRLFKKGEYLFHQGDPTQVLFIIKTGSVRIFKIESNIEFDLATVGQGAVLGEITVIDRGLRSASGVAVEDTEVIAISADDFDVVFSKMPEWFRKIALILVQRLREVDLKIKKTADCGNEERVCALLALLLAGDHCVKTDCGFELSSKYVEDEIMDLLMLQPTETIAVFNSLTRQNFIKQGYSKITVLQRDAIEAKALKVLCV